MNDSLASLSEEDPKQTRAKSPLVRYNVDMVPNYDGSIGKMTTVPCSKAIIPPLVPDDSSSSVCLPHAKPRIHLLPRLDVVYKPLL